MNLRELVTGKPLRVISFAYLNFIWVTMLLFFVYCFHVKSKLGRWPVPMEPMPIEPGNKLLAALLEISFVMHAFAFLPWLCLTICLVVMSNSRPEKQRCAQILFWGILALVIVMSDPKGLIGWFLD